MAYAKTRHSQKQNVLCEPCKRKWEYHKDGKILATMYCIDCKENLCDSCSDCHISENGHNSVKLENVMKNKTEKTKKAMSSLKRTTEICNDPSKSDHGESKDGETFRGAAAKKSESSTEILYNNRQPDQDEKTTIPANQADILSETSTNNRKENEDGFDATKKSEAGKKLISPANRGQYFHSLMMLIENDLFRWLTEKNYSELSQIVQKPSVEAKDLQNFWKIVSPYLIQRIKMWNGNVVTPLNISSILQPRKQLKKKKVPSEGYSISRIDFLTSVLNAAESNVAQDILMKLAKFHLAIPLIVQDIRESDRFIVTLPIIKSIIIKCESNPGEIIENRLFSDKFRLIVSVRMGNSNIGKSTVLNQLMKKQHMFSSRVEPGKEFGRSQTLDGMVEMIWLTQDTCADVLWKGIISEHSKLKKSQEVVILANLHGDAMKNIETIKFLATFASSFVVFQMPDYSDVAFNQLQEIINTSSVVHVLVNPEPNDEDNYEIFTDALTDYETQETLINVLKESLTERQFDKSIHEGEKSMHSIRSFSRIIEYGTLNCQQVDDIIGLVGKTGCLKIKQYMRDINDIKYIKWSQQLKNLCEMSIKMFCLPLVQAKTSLIHLETQLSIISNKESVSAQDVVRKANARLQDAVNAIQKTTAEGKLKHDAEIKNAREALQRAMKDVDNKTLGQEHFFRILGQIYTKSLTAPELQRFHHIPDLSRHLAELLINGYAIEILDGDSVEVQSIWIQAIFENVTKSSPAHKVFVISIIGLQSTGKSTLLNALFSCRFPVSTGRCSRGLFMRMIFLDDELSQSLGFQCILLIDSEGLCSPEKMNDKKAMHDDRLIATYAMSISNLTIVNILGEGMTEMTEILQMAIIAMSRLRLGKIRPDILIVQHLQERNLAKIEQANSQFCEAINKAFDEIRKNDVEIGSVSAECLDDLIKRIHSKDLFKHFGAFKEGSSVDSPPSESYHEDVISLYEILLRRANLCRDKLSFEHWSRHFESNWNCVKGENFALNFKNVKMITDFLFIDKKIAKVKEDLDVAIRFHRDVYAKTIRQLIRSLILEKQQAKIDDERRKLFENYANWFEDFPSKCIGVILHFNIYDKISRGCQMKENCGTCKTFKESYDNLLSAIYEIEGEQDRLSSLKEHRDRLISVTKNMLGQTFDGSVARQGYFSENSQIITKELIRALEERPQGQYSDMEIKEFAEKILSSLRQIAASKEADSVLREKIIQAIAREYAGTDVLERFNVPIILDKSQAGYGRWIRYKIQNANSRVKELLRDSKPKSITEIGQLNKEQICNFKDLITSNEIDWEHVRETDFALKKVREIKTEFLKQIKDYEQKIKVRLSDMCKRDLEIYTLQQMRNKILACNEIFEKINHALDREYVQNGVLPDILEQIKKQVTVADLLKINAVRTGKTSGVFSADKPLDKQLMNNLTDKLSRLIEGVLDNRADNWRTDGLSFEDGMVIEIKNCFPDTIREFGKKFGTMLHDNFKNRLEIYTIQQLRDKMIVPQIKWNRNNKPSEILEQKHEDYIREIETRLKFGFSAAGEGVLVGQILCKSIKEIAVQEAYSLIIMAAKNEPWTKNTETVRLHYFEKLAEEVARGDKKRALEHFCHPKESIEKWFESEIDSMGDEETITKKYEDTIAKKLKQAVENIKTCSTKSEIDKIIASYIKYGDDKFYSNSIINNLEFETFKNRLLRELEGYENSAECQMIDCMFPSNDSVTMGRLGCTERCHWCGALCWASRGHYIIGKKAVGHHTCHQPPGLRGTHDPFTKELSVEACHNWKDTSSVQFGTFTSFGLLWSVAKAKHFNDWKFNVHSITAFDKMMRWFFQELHKDIAEQYKLLPANRKKLEAFGCNNLELDSILPVVRSKIYT